MQYFFLLIFPLLLLRFEYVLLSCGSCTADFYIILIQYTFATNAKSSVSYTSPSSPKKPQCAQTSIPWVFISNFLCNCLSHGGAVVIGTTCLYDPSWSPPHGVKLVRVGMVGQRWQSKSLPPYLISCHGPRKFESNDISTPMFGSD